MTTQKKVVITGGTSGIGKACVKKFLHEGHHVIITSHGEAEQYTQLREELSSISKHFEIHQLHVDRIDSIREFETYLRSTHGSFDILVNSAGAYSTKTFYDITEESWDHIMNVDLKGTFFITQILSPLLTKAVSSSIISVASVAGCYPRKTHVDYAIAKAGVVHLSKCLAQILAPIRVNSVAPSYTATAFMPEMNDPTWVKEKLAHIPLGAFNQPEDVANSVYFLSSSEASMITGETLTIDGGRGGIL